MPRKEVADIGENAMSIASWSQAAPGQAMPIHIILLTTPSADVIARIEEKYPNHHQVMEGCYLVQSKELTQDIAVNVGLKGEGRVEDVTGVVFKLNGAYSGYAARTLWEWLGEVEEAE